MIEQAMFFVLGVCVAGLAALLFVPAITRRATSMAREQVERQMPLSIEEIVAQRDLLRAEFAAERRKIEQVVDELNQDHAHDMAELGRRAVKIGNLEIELGDVKRLRDAVEIEHAETTRAHREITAENFALHKSLFDEASRADDFAIRHDALGKVHASLQEDADLLTRELAAGLDAVAASQSKLEQTERELMQTRLDHSVTQQNASALAARLAEQEALVRETMATMATVEALKARHAALEGGLAPDDLASLRRAIVEIGEKVVRMDDERGAPQPGSARQREASASVN